MVATGAYFSFRYIHFSFNWRFIAKSSASAALMALAIALLDPTAMSEVLFSIAIGISVYFTSLFILRGIEPAEVEIARSTMASTLNKGRVK